MPSNTRLLLQPRVDSWLWWTMRRSTMTWCGDMTEILTSMCARLYGKRAGANRAWRAVEIACADEVPSC